MFIEIETFCIFFPPIRSSPRLPGGNSMKFERLTNSKSHFFYSPLSHGGKMGGILRTLKSPQNLIRKYSRKLNDKMFDSIIILILGNHEFIHIISTHIRFNLNPEQDESYYPSLFF